MKKGKIRNVVMLMFRGSSLVGLPLRVHSLIPTKPKRSSHSLQKAIAIYNIFVYCRGEGSVVPDEGMCH